MLLSGFCGFVAQIYEIIANKDLVLEYSLKNIS